MLYPFNLCAYYAVDSGPCQLKNSKSFASNFW